MEWLIAKQRRRQGHRAIGPMPVWHRTVLLAALLALFGVGIGRASAARTKRPDPAEAPLAFTGYVVDQANILSIADRRQLTAQLGRFERDTKHQFAVVTVASLSGEDVKTFTIRLARRWGVGRKGHNDGVVLLVAPNDRKVRISVGYGLERQLPDRFCAMVLDTKVLPSFRHGQFGRGIGAGVSAIISRLEHDATGLRSARKALSHGERSVAAGHAPGMAYEMPGHLVPPHW